MKECPTCKRCFPDETNYCLEDGSGLKLSLPGEQLLDGRYQLERRIGQGATGIVYQARHVFLKTQHAIKIILPDLVGNDPMLVTRFRQAALAAAALRHQNIVAVTDFGVLQGSTPYLVMDFILGRTLGDIIAEGGPMSPERALDVAVAIARGLAAAQRQNIFHRNLTPSKVMLEEGQPINEGLKILDFGLFNIRSGELLGSFNRAETTGLMDSPSYMAPEVWGDEEIDARADVYSLGVILYQMLSGEVPFKGSSIPAIMKQHLTSEVPPLSSQRIEVSPQIEAAVRHALAKDPAHRPASAEEFVEELRGALPTSAVGLSESRRVVALPDERESTTLANMAPPMEGAISGQLRLDEELARAVEQMRQRKAEDERKRRAAEETKEIERPPLEETVARQVQTIKEKLQQRLHTSSTRTAIIPPASSPQPRSIGARDSLDTTPSPIHFDENVQFTVYRPRVIKPLKPYSLLACAHLSERSRPDDVDPIEEMKAQVKRIVGAPNWRSYLPNTEDSSKAIPRMGQITFVPSMPGIEFNPASRSFLWEESVHVEHFRIRATSVRDGETARGYMSVYFGAILVAEINFSIKVDSVAGLDVRDAEPEPEKPATPFRNIFPSYSHKDMEIVAQIEQYARVTGDRYLRDVHELRSGQNWKEWMLRTIERADIFQLFWSTNSMRSENVRREWEHALALNKPHFIRPTYWETPLPESRAENLPPPALKDLHFQLVSFPAALFKVTRSSSRQDDAAVEGRGWGGRSQNESQRMALEEAQRSLTLATAREESESRRRYEELLQRLDSEREYLPAQSQAGSQNWSAPDAPMAQSSGSFERSIAYKRSAVPLILIAVFIFILLGLAVGAAIVFMSK